MLQAGDPAPPFALAADGGRSFNSRDLAGIRHVLYFYPKDSTPGCTREACAFRDQMSVFDRIGTRVFGVSADKASAHDRFVHKQALNFPLLADIDHALSDAYGVWLEKSLYGRKYFGIQRSTFVIDKEGRIEKVWDKVNPDLHAGEVLAYLTGQQDRVAVPKKSARRA